MSRRGFTLLEILVTVALLSLLATVLIAGAGRLMADRPETPEEIFRKAIEDARQFAVMNDVEVRLSFDPKEMHFRMSTERGDQVVPVEGAEGLTIEFLATEKSGTAMLLGGELVETQLAPYVKFFPDGTCSPFRAQLRLNGDVSRIEIDPWTCAPVLESKKQP